LFIVKIYKFFFVLLLFQPDVL